MPSNQKLNLAMLVDFYEFTMSNGYFLNGYKDRITYFDVFYRSVPDGGGFAIVRSRPFRPRGKSAQAQSAVCDTRLRSILETYGKPASSLRLSRIHLRLAARLE